MPFKSGFAYCRRSHDRTRSARDESSTLLPAHTRARGETQRALRAPRFDPSPRPPLPPESRIGSEPLDQLHLTSMVDGVAGDAEDQREAFGVGDWRGHRAL